MEVLKRQWKEEDDLLKTAMKDASDQSQYVVQLAAQKKQRIAEIQALGLPPAEQKKVIGHINQWFNQKVQSVLAADAGHDTDDGPTL
ncbi:hypothetical protein HYR54_13770 [Candidatus Acetothermia bacterium]|nr:hypothetical protein [Candidatus Acetothermia bacterium]